MWRIFALLVTVATACAYTRDQAVYYGMRYLDINNDHRVSFTEMNYAYTKFLNAEQRATMPVLPALFASCDPDKSGLISEWDFENSVGCIDTCKQITDFIELLCWPARAEYIDRTGHVR